MTSMVERVARTLCATRGVDPDKEVHCQGGGILYEWHWWEREARAAITSMREPTGLMVDGAYVAHEAYEAAPEPKAWCGLASAYSAMIDAALEEKP